MSRSLAVGSKVRIVGCEDYGFGEIASYPDSSDVVSVSYYRGPAQFDRIDAETNRLRRDTVPAQTRCFVPLEDGLRIGRVLSRVEGQRELSDYHIALPNEPRARRMRETDFHVRSLLGPADPVEVLAALGPMPLS